VKLSLLHFELLEKQHDGIDGFLIGDRPLQELVAANSLIDWLTLIAHFAACFVASVSHRATCYRILAPILFQSCNNSDEVTEAALFFIFGPCLLAAFALEHANGASIRGI
jgi:hypothetical protein